MTLLFLNGAAIHASDCPPPQPATFTVQLPKLDLPPDEEDQGWERPPVWEHHSDAYDDEITIPNGRPIYALIVSGFGQNKFLDEIMVYNFVRHLQTKNAYVHYAWWNNLMAPYMKRPLHHDQSHPGGTAGGGILNFASAEDAGHKAVPAEDYQFVADAKLFLSAIRAHNPSAMIIVVGHSMGGGAVVHLAAQSDVLSDILAPIDPVGNRNYPWAGPAVADHKDFNWTRWRVTRDNFLGYQKAVREGLECVPVGPWLRDRTEADNDPFCTAVSFAHDAPTLLFGSNIVNLHHRWQTEALFPFDYKKNYTFGHDQPTNGTTSQSAVAMKKAFTGLKRTPDKGGWPVGGKKNAACCTSGDKGVGWGKDGHGEIIGHRGPLPPVPLGVRLRTSPECGTKCDDLDWPTRTLSGDTWSNGNASLRVTRLKNLEKLAKDKNWKHRPTNPNLCRVSTGLINKYNAMNKPPAADAGDDQIVECSGPETQVILNGMYSDDPDGDALEYRWTWADGSVDGPVAIGYFPMGVHCVRLEVKDPSGHIDHDYVEVIVQDTTPPLLSVQLTPQILWPPNHTMTAIHATVLAEDECSDFVEVTLISVVSNQPDDAQGDGDGHTVNDIQGVELGTFDVEFMLRAERAGGMGDRHYTVTYQAIDASDNVTQVSVDVIVPHDAVSLAYWMQQLN